MESKHDGRHFGSFTSERAAVLVAIEAAHSAGGLGHQPRVLGGPTTKKLYVEWTYGDLLPPDLETFKANACSIESQPKARFVSRG